MKESTASDSAKDQVVTTLEGVLSLDASAVKSMLPLASTHLRYIQELKTPPYLPITPHKQTAERTRDPGSSAHP